MSLSFLPKEPEIKPSLTLYTFGSSPNGQKITILLEFLEIPYNYKKINIYLNEHKEDWFLELNPNGRIPVLTDFKDKKLIKIFETGAILMYISEEYDLTSKISFSLKRADDLNLYWDQVNWLMFQISNHSPYQSQLSFFLNLKKKYNKEFSYIIDFYLEEILTIFQIYENRLLNNNGWIINNGINIVDISTYPWVLKAIEFEIIDIKKFPEVSKWIDRLEMFEAVRKGIKIGTT